MSNLAAAGSKVPSSTRRGRSRFARLFGAVATVIGLSVPWAGVGASPAYAASPAFNPVTGSPFPTNEPYAVAFSPSGDLLAATNFFASSVSVFSVGPTGALSQVLGSPFATGGSPASVAFSPSGNLLAIANSGAGTVSVFSVGPTGALSQVLGSPFAAGAAPTGLAFSPSGGLLAVTDDASSEMTLFSVSASGALSPVVGSPFLLPGFAESVAFSPSGDLLATANYAGSTVSVFSVGPTGALSQVLGSPFATGGSPTSVAFNPLGNLLAIGSLTGNTVYVYSVASNGALTSVDGSPFAAGPAPNSVAFSTSGNLLATADFGTNTVSVFTVSSNGTLSSVAGSPFTTGVATASVAFSSGGLLATANEYDNSGSVSVLSPAPPTATISSPPSGGTYTVGQSVPTAYSCSDSYGPGIASCTDSNGSTTGAGSLGTSTPGNFTYTVTAISKDGEKATASITYIVQPASPNVTSLSPTSGASGGHRYLEIFGSNLSPSGETCLWYRSPGCTGISVQVGTKAAFVIYGSPGELLVLTPAGSPGAAPVTVTVGGQVSAVTPASTYAYN